MKPTLFFALCLVLLATACTPPRSSPFLASFNPVTTLSRIGTGAGISYSNGSAGTSSSANPFSGSEIQKDWSFSFAGSHPQLMGQLDVLRADFERQLLSSGAKISGRGTWSDDFSGFSFQYTSGGKSGFVRTTGVSFESGRQGLEILVHEH